MCRKPPKKRNPVARELRAPVFLKRIVRSRKLYQRKVRGKNRGDTQE